MPCSAWTEERSCLSAPKEEKLLELAGAGDAEGLAWLIDAGFNVAYQRTSDGMTALMVAAEAGHIGTVSRE